MDGPPVEKEKPVVGRHGGSRERLRAGFQGEAAGNSAGQIPVEVIGPAPGVYPSSLAFLRALDVEGVGKPRVAEGDHGLREPGRHLPDLLDGALR